MISIIIPAYNEEKYIEPTLKSIKNQDFRNYEIIVVCNGCTDKTKDIAKKYTNKVYELNEKNVSKARNYGAKKAKYDKLIFLDADVQITKNTLETISKINSIGTCKAIPDNNKLGSVLLMKIKNIINKTGRSTGLIFCNRNLFDKTGFNEKQKIGEDTLFIKECKRHSTFVLADTFVINSMRRFEKVGYFNLTLFWIKKWVKNQRGYPPIR